MPSNQRPSVSVVIPTFNRARLVVHAIEAALAQTYRNLGPMEVIVVDDGSTDGTAELVPHRFPDVKYVRRENSGPVCTRIAGVEASTGDLICFCDDDDRFRPTKVEAQVSLFERFPQTGMCITNFEYFFDGEASGLTKFSQAPAAFFDYPKDELSSTRHVTRASIYDRVVDFQPTLSSTTMFRRDFLQQIGGFNPAFTRSVGEDYEFILRASHYAPLGVCSEPLVELFRHSGNRSGNLVCNLTGNVRVLQHALEHHEGAQSFREAVEREIGIRAYAACKLAFEARDWSTFNCMRRLLDSQDGGMKFRIKRAIARIPSRAAKNFAAHAIEWKPRIVSRSEKRNAGPVTSYGGSSLER